MPTPSTWRKTTPFGNYLDPEQNHKENVRDSEQYNLVHRVRNFGHKHPGSKNIHTLRMYK